MSETIVTYPIWTALQMIEKFLSEKFGSNTSEWNMINDKQKALMKMYDHALANDSVKLDSIKEIESMASNLYEDINKFLEDRGFDIRLEPFSPENSFGVASVFQLLTKWVHKGKSANIQIPGGAFRNRRYLESYPGVKIKKKDRNLKVIKSANHEEPIAYLLTQSKYRVFMTIADKDYSEFELFNRISDIINGIDISKLNILDYDSVMFPKVDLDVKPDISWLKQMFIFDSNNREWFIKQALQQTRLQLNELGLKAESAVAIEMRLKCVAPKEKEPLVIDKPFFFWISHPKLSFPVFMAYVTEEDWKDPGKIDFSTKEGRARYRAQLK